MKNFSSLFFHNLAGDEEESVVNPYAFADNRPEVRATQVVFYDQVGHIVPFDFDPDTLSRGKEIYLSGYFKCLTDDDPLPESRIPVTQGIRMDLSKRSGPKQKTITV